MIIVLKHEATRAHADAILAAISREGLKPLYMPGTERVVLGALGDERVLASLHLESHPMVDRVVPILSPYKLASRELYPSETVIDVGGRLVGAPNFSVMAGPCAVESEAQIMDTARRTKAAGATFLRGGAFKPRSSPYSFQGLGEEGLRLLRQAGDATGLAVVTEVMAPDEVALVAAYADVLQVGARNMQNFRLLREVGQAGRPVLLKRGMAASLDELLMSAEYVLSEGNPAVILCERGIKTFETAYRNTLDLAAVPVLKSRTHLPVIVDPSHAAGYREYVIPLAKAALVCGADGIIVEVHPEPERALSDGRQSLYPTQFEELMKGLRRLAGTEGRVM